VQAYRSGFCSRRLVSEFSYVWIMVQLIYMLVSPAKRILLTIPSFVKHYDNFMNKLLRKCGKPPPTTYQKTLDAAAHVQNELVETMSVILTAAIFACVVPILVILLPLGLWLQLCSIRWCNLRMKPTVGQTLASQILVQQPS